MGCQRAEQTLITLHKQQTIEQHKATYEMCMYVLACF